MFFIYYFFSLSFFSGFCEVKVAFFSIKPVFCRIHFAVHFLHFNLKWTFFFLNLHAGFSSLFVFLFMVLCSDFIEEMSFWSLLETQIRNALKISPSLAESVFHMKIFSLSPQSGRFIWTVLSIPLPAIFHCVLIITRQCDVCPEPVLRSQSESFQPKEREKEEKIDLDLLKFYFANSAVWRERERTRMRWPCRSLTSLLLCLL